MSMTVCIGAMSLGYTQGAGHLWVCLNWALGLRALGCRIIWLEAVWPGATSSEIELELQRLKGILAPYGLDDIALATVDQEPLPRGFGGDSPHCEDAAQESDLLLNFKANLADFEVRRFRRSALMDIDPGLRQLWMSSKRWVPARHDVYFTIGETVGRPWARFPDCGIPWHYTPPAVFLPEWPVTRAPCTAAYTTLAHWWGGEEQLDGHSYQNDKRASFLDYLELPQQLPVTLELALCLGSGTSSEAPLWEGHGWAVTDAWQQASTPGEYQEYIRRSRGEFSCAKPSCMRLENAWISDRTVCYLASGKPAVVQHTGPSRILPDAEGLLRFRTPEEARIRLLQAERDYEAHCQAARRLAEEVFDAQKLAAGVLERALDGVIVG
jgi:hypothetical protein